MSADDQVQTQPEKPSVADQVAAESAKRAAKKTAQKRAAKKAAAPRGSTGKTKVRMTTSSRGVKAGAQRTLPTAEAERLIRQGHAIKA